MKTSRTSYLVIAAAAVSVLVACGGSSPSQTAGTASTVAGPGTPTSTAATESVPATSAPLVNTSVDAPATPAPTSPNAGNGLPVITDHDPRYLYTIVTGAGGGLLVTRLDGSDEVRLGTDVDGVLKHARWSPDGQDVVFVDETQNEIWIAHLNGSPSTKLPGCEDHNCDYPSYSPDGTKVTFSRWTNGAAVGPKAVGVFVLDLATGDVSEVLTLQRPLLADVPIWMPDGENLVIGVDQMNDNADETGAAVAIVPASGGEPRYVTEFSMFGYYGIPNPTSGEIVFGTPFVTEGTASDAYAIQPDGTGLRQITHVAAGEQIRGPKWTPDGTMLLANSTTQGHVTIDPITGEISPIPNAPADTTSPHLRP